MEEDAADTDAHRWGREHRQKGPGPHRPAGAALTLVAAALTAACQTAAPGGPRTSEASFTVHYERPSARDKDDAAFVRAHKLPEEAVRSVTALVKLDPPVVMSVRSCAGEGSAYDPDTRRVEICYDEITETRELYRDSGERLLDDTLSAVMLETLFHESAHAVIDALDLRVGGREEDFADQFAALMLLRQGAQGKADCSPPHGRGGWPRSCSTPSTTAARTSTPRTADAPSTTTATSTDQPRRPTST